METWTRAVSALHWGDVPTWLAAGATVIALVFAWRAAKAAWATFTLELSRETLRDKEVRRFQASKVAVWADWPDSNAPERSPQCLVIFNASDLPVYNVFVFVFDSARVAAQHGGPPPVRRSPFWGEAKLMRTAEGPVRPGATHIHVDPWEYTGASEAGEADGGQAIWSHMRVHQAPLGHHLNEFDLEISFTDANGRYWHRCSSGKIDEFEPEDGDPRRGIPVVWDDEGIQTGPMMLN